VAEKQAEPRPSPPRRGALIGTYVAAALLGYLLGGRLSSGAGDPSTPLARVGQALQRETASGPSKEGKALRDDVEAVRAGWKMEDRDAFDLVVALRGLATDGNSDWEGAERICRRLKWPRCDRAALEEMKRRSRP
jgi:hypothetical protein